MRKQLFFGLLFLSLLGCTPGKSQDKTTSVPLDSNVCYGQLENGFTYYIRNYRESDSNKDHRIFFQLIGPGGRFEDEDQLGLAHLIEHMILETKSSHFDDTFYDHYIKNKTDLGNWAMRTGPYQVIYNWSIPGNDSVIFAHNLQRLRDFAQDEQILKNLQNTELVDKHGRETVLQEYKSHDRTRLEKQFKLLNKPLGHSSADPEIKEDAHNQNIKTFRLESLVRFYKDWYRPDKQALIIVGNVDVNQVEKQVKGLFSNLRMPDDPRDKSLHEFQQEMRIVPSGKGQVITLTGSTANDIELEIYYKRPSDKIGGTIATKKQYRTQLTERLYTTMISHRMASITQQYNTPFKGPILSYMKPFPSTVQLESALTQFKVKDVTSIPEAIGLVMNGLEQIRRYGFTRVELQRAKDNVLEEINKDMGPLTLLYQYQSHYLFDALAPGPEHEREMAIHMIEEIILEEIHHFAKKWLDSPDWDMVFTVPENIDYESLPDENVISDWITEIKKTDIDPFQDQDTEGPKQLIRETELSKLSDNSNFTQMEIPELGVTHLILDNGFQIFLKPIESNKDGIVHLTGISPIGTSYFTGKNHFMASKSAAIVMNSGAGDWNKFDLARFNENNNINVEFRVNENSSGINGSATIENLENFLQQVYLYITAPRKNKKAFNDWLMQEKENLLLKKSLDNTFYDLVNKEVLGIEKNERHSRNNLEDIQLDRVYGLFNKLFSNSEFTYVIAGDFNVDQAKPLLLKYLGSLPKMPLKYKKNHIGVKDNNNKVQPMGGVYKTFYNKNKENYAVSINYVGEYMYEEETILKLEILKEILHTEIAVKGKKEGLYWPIGLTGNFEYNYYRFISGTGNAKESLTLDKVKTIVEIEVQKLQEIGPNMTVFHNTINKLKANQKKFLANTNPKWWCGYLLEQQQNGWNLNTKDKKLALLDQITPEDIRNIACKYLAKNSLSIIEMHPENNLYD